MSGTTTAKVRVHSVTPNGADQVTVGLSAHYRDGDNEINQEWAKWTPSLSLSITVKAELADRFPVGQAFLLTFTPED